MNRLMFKRIWQYKPFLLQLLQYPYRKIVYRHVDYTDFISRGCKITPSAITMGKHVYIGRNGRIEAIKKYNDVCFQPHVILHDRVSIEQNIHLTCAERIEIGANTAIAANVTITDINHPYEDISLPIERQDLEVRPVFIGEECKIYNGSVILPGVHIGKHCVVGANSVVTRDVPDYCVVVGAPARIVKQYDFNTNKWLSTAS